MRRRVIGWMNRVSPRLTGQLKSYVRRRKQAAA
jgi:hypothetical protein